MNTKMSPNSKDIIQLLCLGAIIASGMLVAFGVMYLVGA